MAEVSFGEWLKRQRGANGWTQKQLAQQMNCSVSALRKMEAEERRPSVQVMDRMAEIFHIPLNKRKSFLQFARGDWYAFSIPDGEIEDVSWHIPSKASQSNLPASFTSFVGREKDQVEILELIKKRRLVTLVGAGGIGKTRLALQLAQNLLNDHPGGVWFVALESLSDPALIPSTVAAIFEIRDSPTGRPLVERLTESLRPKTALLILDNCEHLLEGCIELITTLLTHCPHLKILTTSRASLNMEGEATYYLSSLSLPNEDEIASEKAGTNECVRLFSDRAELALTSFQLTSDTTQSCTDICRLLDGIPLAIELAAARVDILQAHEILQQLQHCFDLLFSDHRGAIARHQTMRASMDWSWELLNETEQQFLQQLSVFAGGWTLESAQAVCRGDVIGLTSALVKKSLIMVIQEAGRTTRYRFHEIVRQYTREKWVKAGDEAEIRTGHLRYFLQFAERAESALKSSAQMEWYLHLQKERNNLRAALEWADQTDTEAGLFISGRLHRFWENFDMREGQHWLDTFLEKPESKNYPQARASALYTKTWMLHWSQKPASALSAAKECLDLYKSSGNIPGEIDGLLALVLVAPAAGNIDGIELYHRALTLSKSLSDPWKQAQVLFQSRFLTLDDYHHTSYLAKSVTYFKKAGDLEWSIQPMLWLANEEMTKGDLPSAQQWMSQAMQAGQALHHKGLRSLLLLSMGSMELLSGEYEKARANLEEAIQLYGDLGNRLAILWARVRLGYVAVRQGELTKARDLLTETAQDFRESQGPSGVIFALEGMANLHVASEKPEHAARLIGWADFKRKETNNKRQILEQTDVDKFIEACLAKMGEVAFSDAYDEGQKMSLDEAVAYALQETD
ncbi:MAG TPA: helix-turn-helix domain-containing protein [Anaerolineales bacterium]|nr:helix-turn-helix domain-containing protein [Anaerolineales bacterium]